MAITISIANQKGGVGKTTTAQTMASILGARQKRVLLIDIDSQSNSTFISGANEFKKTITKVLDRKLGLKDAIVNCTLYDLLCADEEIAKWEKYKPQEIDHSLLNKLLAAVQANYDFIIIDTPPALGNLLLLSLVASDYVVIPTDPRPLAIKGIDALNATIDAVKTVNKRLKILGILLVKHNERSVLNRQLKELMKARAELMNTTLFNTFIRDGVAVPESQLMCKPLVDYSPKSNPCTDYEAFVDELLKMI